MPVLCLLLVMPPAMWSVVPCTLSYCFTNYILHLIQVIDSQIHLQSVFVLHFCSSILIIQIMDFRAGSCMMSATLRGGGGESAKF